MSPRRSWIVLAGALLLGAVLGTAPGCDPRGGRQAQLECTDSGECTRDEGELIACVSGDCRDVECLASADCALGSYCDVEGDYDCVEGCETAGDCLAGYSCNDGDCERDACRSTVLDCDFMEVCNQDSGECERAGGVVCARCDSTIHDFDQASTLFDFCDDTFLGHPDCGVGALCANTEAGNQGHCMPPCETADDCPHGFQCAPLVFGATPMEQGGCDDTNTPQLEGVWTNPVCFSTQCGE